MMASINWSLLWQLHSKSHQHHWGQSGHYLRLGNVMGLRNPQVSAVGCSGVWLWVWVEIYEPKPNLYPWGGFDGFCQNFGGLYCAPHIPIRSNQKLSYPIGIFLNPNASQILNWTWNFSDDFWVFYLETLIYNQIQVLAYPTISNHTWAWLLAYIKIWLIHTIP